jgi:hypothetical protein
MPANGDPERQPTVEGPYWEEKYAQSSKLKQRTVEPFIPRSTSFQSLAFELVDTLLGLLTCLLLLIPAFTADSDFFYWKDTGSNPTVWPKTSDANELLGVIPDGAVDDAKEQLKET